MKWLEGWFGTASGALGMVWMVFVALVTPTRTTYAGSSTCMPSSDGYTPCYNPSAPGPNLVLVILVGVTVLIYLGVLVGTWLDLRGVRRVGRVVLLTSATLLLFAPLAPLGAIGAAGGIVGFYLVLLTLLAFVAAILACVRRDAPRPASIAQG